MIITSINPESAIDFYDKFGPVFFTKGCNLQCGYCYALKDQSRINPDALEAAIRNLKTKAAAGWYTGATVCGGEPTLQHDLLGFLERLKKIVPVKLDTNGTHPELLTEILSKGLVDYVAMDIKAPKSRYDEITGVLCNYPNIQESMRLISRSVEHEFRTTFDPRLVPGDFEIIAKEITETTGDNGHKYFIQPFYPVQGKIFDSELEKFPSTPKKDLEDACMLARKYLPRARVR